MKPGFKFSPWTVMAGLVIGLVVAFSVLMVREAGYLEGMELNAYDWLVRTQPSAPYIESRVTVIGMTEEDIRTQGWPLTDAALTRVLTAVLAHRPRAIGVDIFRDIAVPPGHDDLEAVLTNNPRIVTAMKFGGAKEARVAPPPVLAHSDQVGFNDLLPDRDGIVRRGLLFLDDGHQVSSALSLQLALRYLEGNGVSAQPDPANPLNLRLGRTTFRPLEKNDGGYVGMDARGYQILIDFQKGKTPIPTFSFSALLAGQVPPEAIRDKIVLIGFMAESVPDLFHTPSRSGLGGGRPTVYGVLLHAHMADRLVRAALEGRPPVAAATKYQEMGWIVAWGLLGGMLGLAMSAPWRFAFLGAGGLVILGCIVYLAFLNGWWVPSVPPALAWLGAAALSTAYMSNQEKRQRALLMQLFSRHLSKEVADAVWEQRDQFMNGGRARPQELIATVLFSDLEGFVTKSQKMDPQTVMEWTNSYIDTMAQLIMDHGGLVDDYFGDGIKADFGVPLARRTDTEIRRDARNAVDCALAMAREMARLNAFWLERHLPTAKMRIGIYTGSVIAGSLGNAQRLKYTTVGDAVNIASRLENFDKESFAAESEGGLCRIFVGGSTMRYMGEDYQAQKVGEVTLKGRDDTIAIYRIIGRVGKTASESPRAGRP